MKKIITTLLLTIFALIGLFGTVKLIIEGVRKNEVVDCLTWKDQAETFPNYFLLKWQDEQCRAHGIVIDTTVVKE